MNFCLKTKNKGGAMAFSVKGKNVLLTGGAKGIGKGIAEVFLKEGANLVFTGRNVEVAKEAEKEFKKINEKVKFIRADVSSERRLV